MSILGKARKGQPEAKILDVTASMQGSLIFQEPVSLRISGRFQGNLETRGDLTIGEGAVVQADITGEDITIAGQVTGKVKAQRSLKVVPPAELRGEIWTPILQVESGARIEGTLHMAEAAGGAGGAGFAAGGMTLEEVAEYLEVEIRQLEQWAREGKIPAVLSGNQWRFEKAKIEHWVATQKSS